jgi:hypothetical protein
VFADPVLSHAWQISGEEDDRATTDEEDGRAATRDGRVATKDASTTSHRKEKSTRDCRLDGRPHDHRRGRRARSHQARARSHQGRRHDFSSEGEEEHAWLPAGRTTARPPTRRTGAQPPGTQARQLIERRRRERASAAGWTDDRATTDEEDGRAATRDDAARTTTTRWTSRCSVTVAGSSRSSCSPCS